MDQPGRQVDRRRAHSTSIAAIAFVATIGLSVGACANQSEATSEAVVAQRDSANVRIIELSDPRGRMLSEWNLETEPLLTIGTTTGASEYELFGAISAARLADGGVAVANSGTREVRVYDAGGTHVRTMGGAGQGPGEFSSLSWLGVTAGDTVVAYDLFSRRASWFTPDGMLARSVTFAAVGRGNPEPLGLSGGRLLMRSGFSRTFGRGEARDTTEVYLYDQSGALAESLGRYAGTERFFYTTPDGSASMQLVPIYGRMAYAGARADRLAIGSSDAFEIDVYDAAVLSLKIRAHHEPRPVSSGDVGRERRSRQANVSGSMQQIRSQAIAATPARETLPAFGQLLVDDHRWIWVRDHPRFPEEQRRWIVLDSDGVPHARLETPPDLEVYEIGDTYLLGRRRDEDGVEQIVVHRLRREPRAN